MWDRKLTAAEISGLASCETDQPAPDVYAFDSVSVAADWSSNNVTVGNESVASLCQPSHLLNQLYVVDTVSYNTIKNLCDVVGGEMPVPKTQAEIVEIHSKFGKVRIHIVWGCKINARPSAGPCR